MPLCGVHAPCCFKHTACSPRLLHVTINCSVSTLHTAFLPLRFTSENKALTACFPAFLRVKLVCIWIAFSPPSFLFLSCHLNLHLLKIPSWLPVRRCRFSCSHAHFWPTWPTQGSPGALFMVLRHSVLCSLCLKTQKSQYTSIEICEADGSVWIWGQPVHRGFQDFQGYTRRACLK